MRGFSGCIFYAASACSLRMLVTSEFFSMHIVEGTLSLNWAATLFVCQLSLSPMDYICLKDPSVLISYINHWAG